MTTSSLESASDETAIITTIRAGPLVACERCRRRKQKCSHSRPTCDKCILANAACIYPTHVQKRGPRPGKAAQLEARIYEVERMIQARSRSLTSSLACTRFEDPGTLPGEDGVSTARLLELIDSLPPDLPNVFYPMHLGRFRSEIIAGTCSDVLIDAFTGLILPHRAKDDRERRIVQNCMERTEKFLGNAQDEGHLLARVSLLFMASCNPGQFTSAWMFKGMAVRACINSNIHRIDGSPVSRLCPGGCGDRDAYVDPTSLEAESLRRLWWSVFNIEAFSSLLSTRPQAVDDRDLLIRLPGDDETWMTGSPYPTLGAMYDPNALEEAHLRNPRPIWTRPPRVHVHSEFLPDFTTSDMETLMSMSESTGRGTKSSFMHPNGEGGGFGMNAGWSEDPVNPSIIPLLAPDSQDETDHPMPLSPPSPPLELPDMGEEDEAPQEDEPQHGESAFAFHSRLAIIGNRIGVYARQVYGGRRVTPPDLPHSEFAILHASLARWVYSLPEDAFTTQGPTTFPPVYPLGLLHLSILILHRTRLHRRRPDPLRVTTPSEHRSLRMVRRSAHTLTSLLSLPSLVPFPLTFPKVNVPCSEHAGFTRPWPFLSNLSYFAAVIHSDTLLSPSTPSSEKHEAYAAFVTCRRVIAQAARRSPPSRFHAELLAGLEVRLSSSLPSSGPFTFPIPLGVDAWGEMDALLPLCLTPQNVAVLNDMHGEVLWEEGQEPFFDRGSQLDYLHALLRLPPDLF